MPKNRGRSTNWLVAGVEQVFILKGAAWLNLQEAWWRMFRREGLAGQHFADVEEIEMATMVAAKQLNHRGNRGYGDANPDRRGMGDALLCNIFEERSSGDPTTVERLTGADRSLACESTSSRPRYAS
jgi:hypothetical protein